MHHKVTTKPNVEGSHEYDKLPAGTWFWGWKPEGIPMLRVLGGCVSPVNGHLEQDDGTCYFVGKKVWACPDGTEVNVVIGGDPEMLRIMRAS